MFLRVHLVFPFRVFNVSVSIKRPILILYPDE